MTNYLNIMGECKSHGHAKAHVLAEMVGTDQIDATERKTFLKTYRLSGMRLSDFCIECGVMLSPINWFWSQFFNGTLKDKFTYLLTDDEMSYYKQLWNSKNRNRLYSYSEFTFRFQTFGDLFENIKK